MLAVYFSIYPLSRHGKDRGKWDFLHISGILDEKSCFNVWNSLPTLELKPLIEAIYREVQVNPA